MLYCLWLLPIGRAFAASSTTDNTSYASPTHPKPISSSEPATQGLGDYIAFGLGLSGTSIFPETKSTSSGSHTLAIATYQNATVSPVNKTRATTAPANATQVLKLASNVTVNLDQCWNHWTSYWSELPTFSYSSSWIADILYTDTTYTFQSARTNTETQRAVTPGTITSTYTITDVIDNNGFATSTYYREVVYTITETRSIQASTYTTASSWTITYESSPYSTVWSTYPLPNAPNCSLPSTIFSQCDAAWTTWVSLQLTRSVVDGTKTSYKSGNFDAAPSCTQASIGDPYCQSLKDGFISSSLNLAQFSKILPSSIYTGSGGTMVHWSGGYYSFGTGTWKWPPSTAFFAPSCTLGCGRCSIIGGTVDLLYWPPTTATNATNGTNHATVTAAAHTVVTTVGDVTTTLTSPSLYVSYRSLYAEDACGVKVGKTVFDTIIAIPSESTLQSIWGMIGAPNGDETTAVYTSTASFNVSDLYLDPVPMSIYSSQPWCVKWAYSNLWPFNSSWWECPHDQPYKPIIKVPEDLLKSIDPAWNDCIEAFGGVYDPPIALTPVDAPATPTLPTKAQPTSTPAQQASTPVPDTAPVTSQADAITKPTQSKTSSPAQASNVDSSTNPSSTAATTLSDGSQQPESVDSVPGSPKADDSAPSNALDVLNSALESVAADANTASEGSSLTTAHDVPEVAIGSETYTQISATNNAAVFANERSTFSVDPAAGSVVIEDHTIAVSLSDDKLVFGTGQSATTVRLAEPVTTSFTLGTSVTIANQVFTKDGGAAFVFANEHTTFTLDPGASATVGDSIVRLASNSHDLIVGTGAHSTTITLPTSSDPETASTPGRVITFTLDEDNHTISAVDGKAGKYVLDGSTTIAWNGVTTSVVTIDDDVVTLAEGGLIVDGTTHAWPTTTAIKSAFAEVKASTASNEVTKASYSTQRSSLGPSQTFPSASGAERGEVSILAILGALAIVTLLK